MTRVATCRHALFFPLAIMAMVMMAGAQENSAERPSPGGAKRERPAREQDCAASCRPLSGTALDRCIARCERTSSRRTEPAGRDGRAGLVACFKGCEGLSGSGRTDCLGRCREKNPAGGPSASKEAAMRECAERCGSLSGKTKYECVRTCARHRGDRAGDRDDAKSERHRECEGRCGVIDGPLRYKCVQSCMRTTR